MFVVADNYVMFFIKYDPYATEFIILFQRILFVMSKILNHLKSISYFCMSIYCYYNVPLLMFIL